MNMAAKNRFDLPYSHSTRWILAHDIRDPRRLQRVWRFLHKEGVRLQYSVYLIRGTRTDIEKVIQKLKTIIDERVDDVRLYPLTETTRIWGLGVQFNDGGITVCDDVLDKIMQQTVSADREHDCPDEKLSFW
jgi:CRISPR-associated protein Cas2